MIINERDNQVLLKMTDYFKQNVGYCNFCWYFSDKATK